MTFLSQTALDFDAPLGSWPAPEVDPRQAMAERLPHWIQPLLTWLTARPGPQERPAPRSALHFVFGALGWTLGGCLLAALPLLMTLPDAAWVLLPIGLLATSSGLGLFQVVLFHHCSHGTVFATRERNRFVGRLISSCLLFKRFEDYQREHMLHHSAKKLLTEEDEFADFVLGMCRLEPGLSKRRLWRRVLGILVSPAFHTRFLRRRVQASLFTGDLAHDWAGRGFWLALLGLAAATDTLGIVLLVWVLPVTILLQQATVFRILVEHRFPEPEMIARRDRDFVCHATVGVFPGRMPPERGLLDWTGWWVELLTWHLFVRLFVLVGDAPCHDFHHRRPATRRWTGYIHARQGDLDAGSPGFSSGYFEAWGLLRAVDGNLATLAATRPETLGR